MFCSALRSQEEQFLYLMLQVRTQGVEGLLVGELHLEFLQLLEHVESLFVFFLVSVLGVKKVLSGVCTEVCEGKEPLHRFSLIFS